jgi:DNA-binding NarL/FixJ family response regulator
MIEQMDRKPLKVLIADDHPLILAGVRRMLEHSDNIEVVGEAHSGPQLLQLIDRRRPDIVLTDMRMPGMSGPECIESIRSTFPEVKVVVLSASDDRPSINAALQAGASAYVLKSVVTSDLAAIIRQSASGSVFHGTASTHGSIPQPTQEPEGPGLTSREQTILEAIAGGLTTSAIGKELWVSEHTVKFHLTNIYRKLGVANRAGAVRHAIEHGLVAV